MSKEEHSSLAKWGPNTQLVRSGSDPDEFHGFVNTPVVHASTVLFKDTETMRRRGGKYRYALWGTPTTDALEDALDELEGSAGTILLPSGLAAVTIPLLAFLGHGDHVLIVDCVYSPTRKFADTVLKRMGVEVEYFDPARPDGIVALMRPETKVVFLEAPGSNTFEMMDIKAACDVAHAGGAVTMIDNTWATPLFFRPLDHGVDLSIHALTKYPGGHSDVMMGSVSANAATYARLRDTQMTIGINAAPDDTYLVLRGLKTMGLRLERHQESGLALAEWLEGRDEVARVLHPALPSFAGHDLWKRQFKGASGLFSFVLAGGGDREAAAFLDALKLFGLGFSWGGFESLAVHVDLSDRRHATAAPEGPVIRLQVGLEDVADLKTDLERGFAALADVKRGL
ncbi:MULTISPECIES: cystathionine beta-lyase [unclassified Aureimonas]|uniref:cystathionine beta-lyase n=1 Tax=unclassified Aureimonas TaxID=2615206 RepID=UPI0006FBC3E0|nr:MULTISPECIES: cystathionine beta-lyase [unclassified Aureimonas]KQT57507.1 cystathionine beta-lyase [Aureimonas sp. Leaf427]KQT77187.1 cystathionine beta-lyase [Aureimonas sp. Leaf460]